MTHSSKVNCHQVASEPCTLALLTTHTPVPSEASLLQSADKSPPRVQRSSQDVARPRPPSHPLPETVTPFVTQRPEAILLEVTTPYSMGKQTREEWPVKRELPLTSAMTTPASSDHGNMSSEESVACVYGLLCVSVCMRSVYSIVHEVLLCNIYTCIDHNLGIFSPLEPQPKTTPLTQPMTTPLTGKVTAAVPPTKRQGEPPIVTTPLDQENVSVQSGRTSSIPVVPAPPPNVPLATPLIQSSRSTQLSGSKIGAGIFSPLGHSDSLIGQSPLLKASRSSMSSDSHVTSNVKRLPNVAEPVASHVTNTSEGILKPQVSQTNDALASPALLSTLPG